MFIRLGRVRVEQRVVQEVVVAVINHCKGLALYAVNPCRFIASEQGELRSKRGRPGVARQSRSRIAKVSALLTLVFSTQLSLAAVLPEDRADLMYHSYDGGGVTIDGPSLMFRKSFKDKISVSANYYVDTVSSASIDVIASGASEYSEERTEYSLVLDYLNDKTLLSAGFTKSEENDYSAETAYFNVSQDFFGDLSTISFGYSRGNDVVGQNGNENFSANTDRQNLRFGFSQVLTPELLMSLSVETVTEEGYLNNPYRSYRFLTDMNDPLAGYQTGTEVYPQTRTSDAVSLSASYYLPYRAAIKGQYRYFTDDWDIKAHTYTLTYTHPIKDSWTIDLTLRGYQQTEAYFYSDLFEFESLDERDFRARDKELSGFKSNTIGLAVRYQLPWFKPGQTIKEGSISLKWDHIRFNYDNFTDLTTDGSPGEEELYSFDANVIRLFFTLRY